MVYAKTALAGPAAVLDYLSRYTHRTAIGNERLLAMDSEQVRLRVRGDNGRRTVNIPGPEFVGRLMQHVLPPGFKRIRHYGLLAPAAKQLRLETARRLLRMPAPNPVAVEDAATFMRRVKHIEISRCGRCATGQWQLVCERSPDRSMLARIPPFVSRGPP